MTRALRQNLAVITLGQLRAVGFSDEEVQGFLAHGDLRRLHRGVYADGRAPLTDQAYLRAALLAVGGRPWLSGPAAAMGWGLNAVNLPNIELTVVASCTPHHRGLKVRRASVQPHPSEIRTHRGLRMSSIPRMLIESAGGGATAEHLHELIELAVRRNLLDIPDLVATLERSRGRAGTLAVRRVCMEYLPHTDRKSALERVFDRWLLKHPEIPAPERNIRLGVWEIDCYWPAQSLVVELDGRPYHTVVEEIERDRCKDIWLQAHGLRIMRVTGSRFRRNKTGVLADLTTMLALGAGPALSPGPVLRAI